MKELDLLIKDAALDEGACIEVGTHNGDSARAWKLRFPGKAFYVYDTFKGMPNSKLLKDEDKLIGLGTNTTRPGIVDELKREGFVVVVGVFPDEINGVMPDDICFAYFDADNYLTTRDALDLTLPRLTERGLIALHDYKNQNAPGIERAIDEFREANKDFNFRLEKGYALLFRRRGQ